MTRGLYFEAGFPLIEVTSGFTLDFLSYDPGSLVTGLNLHGYSCCLANLLQSRLRPSIPNIKVISMFLIR